MSLTSHSHDSSLVSCLYRSIVLETAAFYDPSTTVSGNPEQRDQAVRSPRSTPVSMPLNFSSCMAAICIQYI
jgi:hypothetical protein